MSLPVMRFLRAGLLAAAAALLAPQAAAAQCTEHPCDLDGTRPEITIWPGSGTYAAGSMQVTITWSDNSALNHNSRVIMYDGHAVTDSFSYTWSNGGAAQSSGWVTVGTGSKTLTAYICDMASYPNCTTVGMTYTGPAPAVRVTPARDSVSVAGSAPGAVRFRVVNTGTLTTTYSLGAACPVGFSDCAASPATATLAPGDSAWVDAGFTAPASGSGPVTLTVAAGGVTSSGSTFVTALAAPDPGYPLDARSLERIERSACVVIGLGGGAAHECGDLRVVHPLPGVRVLNKGRAPTLLYNHQHSRPYVMVAAHVAPSPGTRPDTVRGYLTVGTTVAPVHKWVGWPSDTTKRVVAGLEAFTLPTGIYDYRIDVVGEWNGSSARDTIYGRTGKLVHVNHNGSPFGAGWWLAGVERVYPQPGDSLVLWVGGDGSARIYRGTAGAGWAADGFDRPDTLKKVGTEYVRTLPGGTKVWFLGSGLHDRTVNTVGHLTRFHWSGTTPRLDSIVLPTPPGQSDKLRYVFEYGGAVPGCPTTTTGLTRVGSPAPAGGYRYTHVCADGQRRVMRITDPDGESVHFTYAATWLMAGRTDRRDGTAAFGYGNRRLTLHRRFPAAGDTLHTGFNHGDGLGMFAPVPVWSVYLLMNGPRTDVHDVTYFWLGSYGAPTHVRNAVSQSTWLYRGDPRWPGLVTRVVQHNGFTTTAAYDARGNPVSTTALNPYGDGRHATTTYEWHPTLDAPTRIVAPEGEESLIGYDAYGRREWEQAGPSTARRSTYRYYDNSHPTSPGLLRAIVSPGSLRDSVEYDTRGNLSKVIDPRNVATETLSDRLGRVIRSRVPIGGGQAGFQQDTTIYDLADRVRETIATGPAMNGVSEKWLHVRNAYDPEGNLTEVARWSVPDGAGVDTIRTRWEYDLMGRQTVEIAPDSTPSTWSDNPRDSTFYDRAGNPVRVRTRRFAESLAANPAYPDSAYIRMEYDVLNRLTRRILPAVLYEPRREGIVARVHLGMSLDPYPYYADPDDRLRIPADTAVFGYHPPTGVQNHAANGNAIVRRQVYPNGQLKYDSLYTATVEGRNFDTHKYGLEYRYDRNGRVTELLHPGQLLPPLAAAGGERGNRYGYDGVTGALQSITDPMGNPFRYHYNIKGEPDSLVLPGGVRHEYAFDGSGQLTTHRIRNAAAGGSRYPGTWIRDEAVAYDSRGKMLSAKNQVGLADTLSVTYSGLGHLRSSTHKYWGWSTHTGQSTSYTASEALLHDALGNVVTVGREGALQVYGDGFLEASQGRRNTSSGAFGYQPGSGRLMERAEGGLAAQYEFTHYDAGGNMVFVTAAPMGTDPGELLDRASFYDGGGRLWSSDVRRVEDGSSKLSPQYLTYEEYRLDALGRRVLVRVRRQCNNTSIDPAICAMSSVRRTVWAGDEELYEIQMPEDQAENDVGPVAGEPKYDGGFDPNLFWGRVAYTSGGAIDRPLSIVRMGYVNNPASGLYRWDEFAIVPHWNAHGRAQSGTFHDGARVRCRGTPATSADTVNLCVQVEWADGMFPYSPAPAAVDHWHGTLLAEKRDASGLLYRRNRYYDPATGRFTQEDPIGLAGGLNVYGFAAGDPVSYHDPFGLNCWRIDRASGRRYEVQCPKLESGALESPAFYADPVALGTGLGAGRVAGPRGLAAAGVGLRSGRVIWQAARMLRSSGMAELRSAAQAGVSASVRIGGRTVTYDPAPFSGLTNFADDSFHLGRDAFASQAELTKTVLHELYRLSFQAGGQASGASVSRATNAAANFAERAYGVGRSLRLW